jgi:transposase
MTVPRVELTTSVERRRRWSREEKERLIAASLDPSVSVSEVARSAEIHSDSSFDGAGPVHRVIAVVRSPIATRVANNAAAPTTKEIPFGSCIPDERRDFQ